MRAKILLHRNEKIINQKFVWLKVALVNISRSTVTDCIIIPIDETIIICYLTKLKFL
jgi:hypothetical protein